MKLGGDPMETKNERSHRIDAIKGDPRYDEACKKLLADKAILAKILKECVPEFKDCSEEDIANKYIEGTPEISTVSVDMDEDNVELITGMNNEDNSINEGTIYYDVRFFAKAPNLNGYISLIINIEAQKNFSPGYPLTKRGIYYCARMISSQKGTIFTGSDYGKINKVYSIWICTNADDEHKNTITSYSITEKNIVGNIKENVENYDLLTMVLICLDYDEKNDTDNTLLKFLDVLFSPEIKNFEKKKILSDDFGLKMTKEVDEGVNTMCNVSQGVAEYFYDKAMKEGV